MTCMDESYFEADEIIKELQKLGHDYSAHREELAKVFDDYLFNGTYDWTTDLGEGVRDLRIIQEDHWDQSMDHDEDRPTHETMLFYSGFYVWFADTTS